MANKDIILIPAASGCGNMVAYDIKAKLCLALIETNEALNTRTMQRVRYSEVIYYHGGKLPSIRSVQKHLKRWYK